MEDKLGTFISSLQANPNIAGLPDSTTLRNVFYDKEKAEVLFKSLKSNPNIMGLPEDYDTFAEGLGLSEQLQRPVMPELPTEEILDKQQKTNTSRSLPIYRGIAGNIPAAIFNKKLDKAVERGTPRRRRQRNQKNHGTEQVGRSWQVFAHIGSRRGRDGSQNTARTGRIVGGYFHENTVSRNVQADQQGGQRGKDDGRTRQ